jgi:hypothetical protein
MEKAINILGLLLNFFGSLIIFYGTPKVNLNAVSFADGGEQLNKKYNKRNKIGIVLFCFGFMIQLLAAIFGIFF